MSSGVEAASALFAASSGPLGRCFRRRSATEKVLLRIPRELLREVRDISSLSVLGLSPAFIEVIFELNGTSHTAKFQAKGLSTVLDEIKIAAAAQHLIRGY